MGKKKAQTVVVEYGVHPGEDAQRLAESMADGLNEDGYDAVAVLNGEVWQVKIPTEQVKKAAQMDYVQYLLDHYFNWQDFMGWFERLANDNGFDAAFAYVLDFVKRSSGGSSGPSIPTVNTKHGIVYIWAPFSSEEKWKEETADFSISVEKLLRLKVKGVVAPGAQMAMF